MVYAALQMLGRGVWMPMPSAGSRANS